MKLFNRGKSFTIFIAAGLAAFSLTGCGDSGKTETSQASQSDIEIEEDEHNSETEASDNNLSYLKEAEDDGSIKPVKINIENITTSYDDTDGDRYNSRAAECKYFRLYLADGYAEKYPKLNAAFEEYNAAEDQNEKEQLNYLKDSYAEEREYRSGDYDINMTSENTADVLRADTLVTSIRAYWYGYYGGVHGDSECTGLNYDTQTGKRLALSDVVTDKEKFIELAEERFKIEYSDLYDEYSNPDPASYLNEYDFANTDYSIWTIDNEGVTVYFSVYSLGSYAMGSQNVTVYFDEAPEIFNPKYTEHCEDYVIQMDLWEHNVDVDIDNDGKREPVRISIDYGSDGYSYTVHVNAGGTDIIADDYAYSSTYYLVHSDGRYYVYVFGISDSDYSQLTVVDLASKSIDENKRIGASLRDLKYTWNESGDSLYSSNVLTSSFNDPTEFYLSKISDFLGTKSCYRKYHVGNDGYPEASENNYIEITSCAVKALNDVSCEIADADGNVISSGTIPAGSYLVAVRSDEESFVDLQLIDESELEINEDNEWNSSYYNIKDMNCNNIDYSKEFYRIEYDINCWPHTVNGTDEDKVFSGIQYAG